MPGRRNGADAQVSRNSRWAFLGCNRETPNAQGALFLQLSVIRREIDISNLSTILDIWK